MYIPLNTLVLDIKVGFKWVLIAGTRFPDAKTVDTDFGHLKIIIASVGGWGGGKLLKTALYWFYCHRSKMLEYNFTESYQHSTFTKK